MRWPRHSTAGSKAELVRNLGPWKNLDDLEIAVAESIDWFKHRRLHGEIGLVPPVEYEATHRPTAPAQRPAERDLPASIKPGTGQTRTGPARMASVHGAISG